MNDRPTPPLAGVRRRMAMPGNFLAQDLATLWRMRGLVWVLTRREIAARYAGTAAGIVWAYAQPLLMGGLLPRL